ncbi:DUF1648 domain-containing protein [Paenisporosarcina indica]|uniref:DUF1648 domain-containing protein n=1 Tax=Paenisporosarcina indica TaxID=650093 RepID=UPI00094FB32B|nr:DUF5808 domain-containing protein [Paenisporosarcina indica]
MTVIIFSALLIFTNTLQAFLPKFLKSSESFGVFIPDTQVNDERIIGMKKSYTKMLLITGNALIGGFIFWSLLTNPKEEHTVFVGLALLFILLFISMWFYARNHVTLIKLKKEERWGAGQKERKVVDLQFREQLKLLPNIYFLMPILVNIGLWIYGLSQYDILPNQIPTHWGLNGEVDAFSDKTWLSVSALPLMVLIIQSMLLFFNALMKQSGAKIQVRSKKRSREQQLAFRKYSSWLLFLVLITITLLMGYLQLTIIHGELFSSSYTMFATLAFVLVIFGATMFYTFKVGQSGSRLEMVQLDEPIDGVIDIDDDRHWKFGLFYVNKEDPSLMVEKRFGVGWTMNFGHVGSWIFLVVLIGSIVLISIIL